MDKVKKILIFIVVSFVFIIPNYVLADSVDFQDSNFVYQFHLYFDRGELVADRDFEFPFDLIAKSYEPVMEINAQNFKGEILSIKGLRLASFEVPTAKLVPISALGSKLSVEAPYFSNAKTAIFYNTKNVKVLEIDLAPSGPVCNEDGICGEDVGESSENCSYDCKITPSPTVTPEPQPSVWSRIFSLVNLLGLLVVVVLVFLFRWLRKKKNESR